MSPLSVQMPPTSLPQIQGMEHQAEVNTPQKHATLNNTYTVAKYSSEINFKALGVNPQNYNQAALNALKSNPTAIRGLANYQLNRLKKTQTKEKEIKTQKWENAKKTGKMTETEYENAVRGLNDSHSEEFKRSKKELENILETVEKNRKEKVGEIVKTHGLDSVETDNNIKKLDKRDEVAAKKFLKDLPALDEKPKKSFFQRLFSKSGLAILATALVGAAAITIGVLALPALGVLAAVGFTAALAIPSLYSTVSSFIAVCNPKTRDTLENIDSIRQATSGTPTELAAAKTQLEKDRHAEILQTIDETKNRSAGPAVSGDLLAAWEKEHPQIKKDIKLDMGQEDVRLIDPEIFGLKKLKNTALEELSSSPAAVTKFANHTIARQQKLNEKEFSILEKKLDGLVAIGEKTEAQKQEMLDRCRERQQKDMDALCTQLSSTLDTATRNRALVQARDLAASEAPGGKSFDELFEVREKADKKLVEKFAKELPDLDPDAKKSTFFKRLFSWSGVKMAASLALAALAITAAVMVPPLGIAAVLGLSVSAAASSYSAVSSFVAICNPKTKDVLQNIEDIRNGINGRPTELAQLQRETAKARHEEILDRLKTGSETLDIHTETQQVLDKIEDKLERARSQKNEHAVEELSILQKSVQTVVDAEKTANTFTAQAASAEKKVEPQAKAEPLDIDFARLGIVASRYKKDALDNLKNSPKTIQELATRQINRFQKSQERERTIKNAKWETLIQTGKMRREDLGKAQEELRTQQAAEMEKMRRTMDGYVTTAQNNRLKVEGGIADSFGLDSTETNNRLTELDEQDQELTTKFTKDLPDLDEKPKKSLLRKIFSKPVLAIMATALIGAAAIALAVGALPALGIFAAVGFTAVAAKKIAEKTLHSTASSIAAACSPQKKAVLEHIDDLRTGASGSPTELSGAARQLVADRHDEVLKTIDATRSPASANAESANPLAAWEANHPQIRQTDKDILSRLGHDAMEPINTDILGLKNIDKTDLEHLQSSPDAVLRLANMEIAKRQRANEAELRILTRKLDGQIATGSKTQAEKTAILDRCRERQRKDMDELCSGLSLTLDVAKHNRDIATTSDITLSEKVDAKKTFEELHEARKKADADLIAKYCKDTPEIDGDKKKSSLFKRLFSWSGAKMAVSLALAGLAAAAAVVLLPPLGIAAAIGLTVFALSNSYSAISSFVAICNPNAKKVLQDIDDIRQGIHGRPTELSKMKRDADKESHEEILDRLQGKTPLYQEDYFREKKDISDAQLLNRLDTLITTAKKENNQDKTQSLSLLRKTLETVMTGEEKCKDNKSENDLLLSQMQFAMIA